MHNNIEKIKYITDSKKWIEKFIIKHNICPFASRSFKEKKIFYDVELAEDFKTITKQVLHIVNKLLADKGIIISNAFVIIPNIGSFEDYLDLYYHLEDLLEAAEIDDTIQLASFHPEYQYADTEINDHGNYRNRSPYPMIHILRAEEVAEAVARFGNTEKVSQVNIALLKSMKLEEIKKID